MRRTKRYAAVCLSVQRSGFARACVRASKLGREREGISVSINICAWQTDQWLFKRSRADDDGYRLYVLTKCDGGNDPNAYVRALAQIRTHSGANDWD